MRRPFLFLSSVRSRAIGLALASMMVLAVLAPGLAQADDSNVLSRYVPKDNLVVYIEFQGLDAHADAWTKSAAYKILNDTPTGVMLEELFIQLAAKVPGIKFTGPELLMMVKHMARSGFVLAMGGDVNKSRPDYSVFVFRDGFKNKEVRPLISRFLGNFAAPNTKLQAVVRSGHKVISGQLLNNQTFAFWNDDSKKEDIVYVSPALTSIDVILETIDGKRPNMSEHPLRQKLSKSESSYVPTGIFLLDLAGYDWSKVPPMVSAMGVSGLKRLELTWGFQGDALMSIAKVVAPAPRKGLLSMFDGPSFDRSSLPPMPESLTGYSVLAFDPKTTVTKIVEIAKMVSPKAEESFNQFSEMVKTKTKLRLKEDILGHLGPNMAWYALPAKTGAPPVLANPTAMSMIMSSVGMDQIPKLAIVIEIDNAVAFGKVLDELMVAANREFKANAKAAGGDAAPGRGARPKAATGSTFEFKMTTGETKAYTLNIPAEQAAMIPPSLRPSIRIGQKYVAIGVNAEAARMALEAKGSMSPSTEVTATYEMLSPRLKYLSVTDPRDKTPAVLAAFPGKLQKGINDAIASAMPPMPPGAGAPPTPAAPAEGMFAAPGMGGGPRGGQLPGGKPATPGAVSPGAISPGSVNPGSTGPNQTPPPGAPGAGAGGVPKPPINVVFQFDAAKLPRAEAIKALMFPSVMAVEVDNEGLRIVSRSAFIAVPDPSMIGTINQYSKMMLSNMGVGMGGAMPMPPGGLPPGMFPPPGMPGPGGPAPNPNPNPNDAPARPKKKLGGVGAP